MSINTKEIEFIEFLIRFEKMIKSEALKSEADIKTKKSDTLKHDSLREIRSIIKQMINVIRIIEEKSSSKIKIESKLREKIPLFLSTLLNSPLKDEPRSAQEKLIKNAIEKAELLKKSATEFSRLQLEVFLPSELHINFTNIESTKNDVSIYLKKLKVMRAAHVKEGNSRAWNEKNEIMCVVGYCKSLLQAFGEIKKKAPSLVHGERLINDSELPKKVSPISLAYLFFLAAGRRYSINIISDVIHEIKKSSTEHKKI